MPITITTLNNEAAAAKTFTEIGKDRVSSEWYNATDETATFSNRLTIKQRLNGKNGNGVNLRQTLVQCTATTLIDQTAAALDAPEEVKINVTIVTPVSLQGLSVTQRKDCLAYIRNFLTATNLEYLVLGQV